MMAELSSDDEEGEGSQKANAAHDDDSPSGSKENDYEPLVNDEEFNPFCHDLSSGRNAECDIA